jgi:hypothetical protein
MLPSGRWALTPPFHPCQMRPTERGGLPVFPKACRRGASVTGGFIFCGTFRSRAAEHAFVHSLTQPPGVTRRVALPWPALASSPRPESGLSSRPFRLRGAGRRSPGSPAGIIIRHVPRGESIVGPAMTLCWKGAGAYTDPGRFSFGSYGPREVRKIPVYVL